MITVNNGQLGLELLDLEQQPTDTLLSPVVTTPAKRRGPKPKKKVQADEIESSEEAEETLPATVSDRNTLNDLTGTEWLPETKSYFFQKGLGAKHPHAQIERQHPAPFSFQDVQRLVGFFTKRGQIVLDPFSGVGSTAKASTLLGRYAIGIELSQQWHDLAIERLETEVGPGTAAQQRMLMGDCREVLPTINDDSVHFVVTSPPYWSILNKKVDHKAKERVALELAVNYSDHTQDLGNVGEYSVFMDELTSIFKECGRVLATKKYMAIIVSDFRHGSKFHAFHSDIIQRLDNLMVTDKAKLTLQGVKALIQNHKSLKPYGYPFAYVENVHHQYVLIFRKDEIKEPAKKKVKKAAKEVAE